LLGRYLPQHKGADRMIALREMEYFAIEQSMGRFL
jgi:hypothetical protein